MLLDTCTADRVLLEADLVPMQIAVSIFPYFL